MLFISCSSDDDNNANYVQPLQNQMTDSRDNQVYKTVQIGTQIWLAENLNYHANDSSCYGLNNSNCFVYGRLYTASAAQIACPEGWHLPTINEWKALFNYFGSISIAYAFLGPDGTLQGSPVNFNLLASGQKALTFENLTVNGYYWTATEGVPGFYLNYKFIPNTSIKLDGALSVNYLKSCRCIKD